MRVQDALVCFVAQLEADGRSSHTIRQYQRHVALFSRWLAATCRVATLDAIDHETLAVFLSSPEARMKREGGRKSAATVNALRTSLRVFFSYAHDAAYMPTNAARLVRRARCGPPPPRALSSAEIARLRQEMASGYGAATTRDRVLVELLLATGVRLSSALGIDVTDVDLEAGEITLRQVKGDKIERVFLGQAIREALSRFIGDRTHGPLFMSNGFARYNTRHAQRRVADWMRQACITHASAHTLRHSFAMGLYARTGDVLLVKQALGHASITSTMRYAQASDCAVRAAVAV